MANDAGGTLFHVHDVSRIYRMAVITHNAAIAGMADSAIRILIRDDTL